MSAKGMLVVKIREEEQEGQRGYGLPQVLRKTTKSVFLTSTQSRFVSVALHSVLGPPHLAHHT